MIYSITIRRNSRLTRRLLYAAKRGDLPLLARLISLGAEINGQNIQGVSPLLKASQAGHSVVVQFLLSHGAQIDAASRHGVTALMSAAENGYEGIVRLLLNAEASIELRDTDRQSALFKAARQGHTTTCAVLRKRDAATEVEAKYGLTPLIAATQKGFADTVQALLRGGANPDGMSEKGPPALAFCRSVRIALLLMEFGADVNASSYYGWTPLMMAAGRGDIDLVRLYIRRRADVNKREHGGRTALHFARYCRSDEMIAVLKNSGAVD